MHLKYFDYARWFPSSRCIDRWNFRRILTSLQSYSNTCEKNQIFCYKAGMNFLMFFISLNFNVQKWKLMKKNRIFLTKTKPENGANSFRKTSFKMQRFLRSPPAERPLVRLDRIVLPNYIRPCHIFHKMIMIYLYNIRPRALDCGRKNDSPIIMAGRLIVGRLIFKWKTLTWFIFSVTKAIRRLQFEIHTQAPNLLTRDVCDWFDTSSIGTIDQAQFFGLT